MMKSRFFRSFLVGPVFQPIKTIAADASWLAGGTLCWPTAAPEMNQTVMGPVTVQMPGHFLMLSEADNDDFSDMAFVCRVKSLAAVFPFSPKGWTIKRRADEARTGVLDGTYRGKPASPCVPPAALSRGLLHELASGSDTKACFHTAPHV